MSKRKHSGNKNHVQLQQYRNFVANSSYSPEGTTNATNRMLMGTGDVRFDNDNIYGNEKVKRTPFKYRFFDWIRKNLVAEIIIGVVVAMGSVTVTHMVKIAVIEQRVQYIEKRLDDYETNVVEKS